MRIPSPSAFRRSWKTILAALLIGITSFTIGSYANRVVVQQVQSIGGNHVTVPAPELLVLNTIWNNELNSSMVTGLILNLTTTGGSGATGSKLYQVEVQVSCLTGTAVRPNCAVGTTLVTLPVNMNGNSVLVPVSIFPSLDPETTEIDDLSFIVTGAPAPADLIMNTCVRDSICWTIIPFPKVCNPADFALFTETEAGGPLTLHLPPIASVLPPVVDVTKIVQSFCSYTGTVTLTAIAPPDLVVSFSPSTLLVPPNGAATALETISTTSAPVLGWHLVMNIASDGILFHTFPVLVNVV